MRTVLMCAVALSAAIAGLAGQESQTPTSLERPFPANGRARMDLVAGDYRIVGADDSSVRLDWKTRDAESLRKVRARVDVRDKDVSISTEGPSNRDLRFTIAVPRQTDLYIRMSAGDLRVEDIRGNKDIELNAGDAWIDVGRADDYSSVNASVWVGDLKAEAFQIFKDGLFRSFDWHGKGPYRLHARLMAGDLSLYAKDGNRSEAKR